MAFPVLGNGINHNSKTVQPEEVYPCLFSYHFCQDSVTDGPSDLFTFGSL